MIIKAADDKAAAIATLKELLMRADASPSTRERIDQEIRNIRAGDKGEREAAYEIDFTFGAAKNWAIIHDLRIEHGGRVAQIDHLIMSRLGEWWVCESKHFSEGITINAHGECSASFGGRSFGVPSPFEQNRKHIMVLESLLSAGAIEVPTRLGIRMLPAMHSLVVISKGAKITRPDTSIEDMNSIVKADQVWSHIQKDDSGVLTRLISPETLEAFGARIAALHKPIVIDWAAKFGLRPERKQEAVLRSEQPNKAPVPGDGEQCPRCHKGTLLPRVARKSGEKFLGCSSFPACRHVVKSA